MNWISKKYFVILLPWLGGCQTHAPPPLPSKLIAQSTPLKRAGIFTSAARPTPAVTGGIESDEAMHDVIGKHVYPGMPLADCQRWFEGEGFAWGVYENLPPYGAADPTLVCRRSDPVSFAVTRQWIISCEIDGDKITDLKTVKGHVGP